MSADLARTIERLGALFESQAESWDWELACKRSVGASFARRRDEASQSERWTEEALAVRVRGPEGRSALSSAAGWESAEETALSALADARRQRLPCAPSPGFAEPWEPEPDRAPSRSRPQAPAELEQLLDVVLEAAVNADARSGRLELGRVRAADVTTRWVNSRGLDLTVHQGLAHLEAELIGRELRTHAGSADAVAGSQVGEEEARSLGDKLGRALRRQFDGAPLAPAKGRVLLTSEVVGEISFRLAPALLGLDGARAGLEGPRVSAGLRLREDSAEDLVARSAAADGIGRRLELIDFVREGRLQPPDPARLPLVRPGIADPPRPGWLRLSWLAEGGQGDEELVAELGAGLLLERAVTDSFDARRLSWQGRVEGWWVEDGVGKRAVARLPLKVDLAQLLPTILAAGADPRPAHGSGTIRAVPWLLDGLPGSD